MRCPYCGGLNREQSIYCVNCGRVMQSTSPQQQAPSQARWPGTQQQQQAPARTHLPGAQTQTQQARPVHAPNQAMQAQQPVPQASARTRQQRPTNAQPPWPQQPVLQPAPQRPPAQQTPATRRHGTTPASVPIPSVPTQPPVSEPPAPFPPRTLDQFNALLVSGAQPYTVVESTIENGKKKVVRIAYTPCAAWQQAATLLKALQEQQEGQYSTILIQGVFSQQQHAYAFTNGQLQFDCNVRLGSAINNRYMVETGDGFASDAVRFVLNE